MGYAEVDITPSLPVTTVGFNRVDNVSRGVLDCLLAQITIWEDVDLSCMVTIDNIGCNESDSDYLRDLIGQSLCINKEKIMLLFSHTHSAPNTVIERDYFQFVCRKICIAACDAKRSMCPVVVGWDNSKTYIGVNRRGMSAEVDRRAGVLKICDAENKKLSLIILRITAHANVLKRDNYLISADFFCGIRKVFKENYRCPVMIVQGSAGNIAPKYFCSELLPVDARGPEYINSPTACDDIALELYHDVAKDFDNIPLENNSRIAVYSKYMRLKSRVPDMEEALKIAEDAKKNCGIDGEGWLEAVRTLNNKKVAFEENEIEVQYFTIGEWCLCGIPNETMTELAIDIEEMLSNHFFYFNGYTNGCSSYLPTEQEYDYGGYEVYWAMLLYYKDYGRVYPYERDAFSKVKQFVVANAL